MQAIVSELALPEEKSLNGLQKALQLAAGGNDISLLFSTIYGCCFARLKPRIVRLLAYEALSQCTASLPQWRPVVDIMVEDLCGDDEELAIAALRLLPRLPPELVSEYVMVGGIQPVVFDLRERSMATRLQIVVCLSTLLLHHPVLALDYVDFASECWAIVIQALYDVDAAVCAGAFQVLHKVVAAAIDPHNSELSFEVETAFSSSDYLHIPLEMAKERLVPSFQQLLPRAKLLPPNARWSSYLPLCWLALQSSPNGFRKMRVVDVMSRLVGPELGSVEQVSSHAAAVAAAYVVQHPCTTYIAQRSFWVEECASVYWAITRDPRTTCETRIASSKTALSLCRLMDVRPQYRVKLLYALFQSALSVREMELRLELLIQISSVFFRVALASPELYVNGLFALDWMVMCLGDDSVRLREELLLALVSGCFHLLQTADKEEADRAAYVVESVLQKLQFVLFWDCSDCVLGLFELFRLIDHMCSEIKSPSVLDMVSQLPSTFGAIRSERRCLRACLLVLKTNTTESVVDGVFQALETRFLSFLWANMDVDKENGKLGAARPVKKEPAGHLFHDLAACLAIIGVRFDARRDRVVEILSRLAENTSDPLHQDHARSLVDRVAAGKLGAAHIVVGDSFTHMSVTDVSQESDMELYKRQYLVTTKVSSPYCDIRAHSCRCIEKQRDENQWMLVSAASSPLKVELHHLLNVERRTLTLFVKAANSTMFPIENTQLEASVTGLNGPHQSVRIDRLHMNDVFEWQVSYTVEDSLAGCSVSLIARFLNATELYPDIRPWQDGGEMDAVSSSISGDQAWSAQNESGGPYLPPLSFKPYKLPAFEFLLPVNIGKSSFQAHWSNLPSGHPVDVACAADKSADDLESLFSFDGTLSCVTKHSYGKNCINLAFSALSWFDDMVYLTVVGEKKSHAWELRLELRTALKRAQWGLEESISTWLEDFRAHTVRRIETRDTSHVMTLPAAARIMMVS